MRGPVLLCGVALALGLAAPAQASLKPMTAWQLSQARALLRLWQKGDAAALAEVQDVEAAAAKVFAPGDARIALVQWPRLQWLVAQGRSGEAAVVAAPVVAAVETRLMADSPVLARLRTLAPPR